MESTSRNENLVRVCTVYTLYPSKMLLSIQLSYFNCPNTSHSSQATKIFHTTNIRWLNFPQLIKCYSLSVLTLRLNSID